MQRVTLQVTHCDLQAPPEILFFIFLCYIKKKEKIFQGIIKAEESFLLPGHALVDEKKWNSKSITFVQAKMEICGRVPKEKLLSPTSRLSTVLLHCFRAKAWL